MIKMNLKNKFLTTLSFLIPITSTPVKPQTILPKIPPIIQSAPTQQEQAELIQSQRCYYNMFQQDGTLKIYRKPTNPPTVTAVWNDGRNYTKHTYIGTEYRDKVIGRLEQERQVYQISQSAAEIIFDMYKIPNPFEEYEFSLDDILNYAPELSEELKDVRNWDFYTAEIGTIINEKENKLSKQLFFLPSNPPPIIYLSPPKVTGNQVELSWQSYDERFYKTLKIPGKLSLMTIPGNIDLTNFLYYPYEPSVELYKLTLNKQDNGRWEPIKMNPSPPTILTDNTASFYVKNNRITLKNLTDGRYHLRVNPIDEVNNIGNSKTLEFIIGTAVAQKPSQTAQTPTEPASTSQPPSTPSSRATTQLPDLIIKELNINQDNIDFRIEDKNNTDIKGKIEVQLIILYEGKRKQINYGTEDLNSDQELHKKQEIDKDILKKCVVTLAIDQNNYIKESDESNNIRIASRSHTQKTRTAKRDIQDSKKLNTAERLQSILDVLAYHKYLWDGAHGRLPGQIYGPDSPYQPEPNIVPNQQPQTYTQQPQTSTTQTNNSPNSLEQVIDEFYKIWNTLLDGEIKMSEIINLSNFEMQHMQPSYRSELRRGMQPEILYRDMQNSIGNRRMELTRVSDIKYDPNISQVSFKRKISSQGKEQINEIIMKVRKINGRWIIDQQVLAM